MVPFGALLLAQRKKVFASPSAATALSANLVSEMDDLGGHFATVGAYRSVGSKMSKMHAMSHARQRSVHTNAGMYKSGMARKAAMTSSWSRAITEGIDDDDSD